ncbi:MAG: pyrimidine-nucleoside phosphorylase, partial [Anaerolineae bacterium]|nr:pyrimidine-nucleoside phosphorylase [Anaerolineae bacterium]
GQGAKWTSPDEALDLLTRQLANGAALAKFKLMVAGQGGDTTMIDDPSKLPQAAIVEEVTAAQSGYIAQVAADEIGIASSELGAGREKKGDPIDLAVGMKVYVKVGDHVEAGAPLVTVYANDSAKLAACRTRLERAITYSPAPVEPLPLFYDTLYGR